MISLSILYSLMLIMAPSLIECSGSDSDKDVLNLNKDNFQSVLDDNAFVLVDFYAPSCGACTALTPVYNEAATIMAEKNSSIKIAKVNAIEETELANKHGIEGYPTVRFFRKGLLSLDYKGLRTAEGIISWLIKRTGPPAIIIKTTEEAQELIKNNNVVTIGFFEDESHESATLYLSAADSSEDSVFAITFEQEIRDDFNAKPGDIILYNKEFENEAVFDKNLTQYEIKKFVELESLPLIMDFTSENAIHLFSGYMKKHLLLFLPKSDPKNIQLIEDLKDVAIDYKGELLFTVFDTDNTEFNALNTYFGVTEEDFPTIRLIHIERQFNKYKPTTNEINVENVRKFVGDYFDGKIKQYLKSEALPEDWNNNPVYVLVASNFESVIKDRTKDVLVEFYAPWCGFCKAFAPEYEKIGKYFETREDVIIAKIDASKNEFEGIQISGIPTIILYTKTSESITYTGPTTFEEVVRFVESGGIRSEVEVEQVSDAVDNQELAEEIQTKSAKQEL